MIKTRNSILTIVRKNSKLDRLGFLQTSHLLSSILQGKIMPLKKIKRAFRGARKAVKKLIPKEIRPALPFIAAAYLGPGAQGIGALTGKQLAMKAAIAGGTRFATDDEADFEDIIRSGGLAIAPDVASAGLGKLAQTIDPNLAKTLAGVDVDAATTLADTGETAAKTETYIIKRW